MDTIIVTPKSVKDAEFLMDLLKSLDKVASVKIERAPKVKEVDDPDLAQKIAEGLKTEEVSREEVMKALGK